MPSIFKKFFFLLITFVTITLSLGTSFAYAQSSQAKEQTDILNHQWYSEQNPFAWYTKVYDDQTTPENEIYGERYTAAQVQWIFYSIFWGMWNMIPGNPQMTVCFINKHPTSECAEIFLKVVNSFNPLTENNISNTGMASLINTIEKSPVSGVAYSKNLLSKFSPVKVANAQGFGFNTGGKPVQFMWTITRNISYSLLVMATIVMAFLVMFRVKIAPQVVVTVQSAIPNIMFSTILITFSYAIAGFVIDLMYVLIGLVSTILISNGFTNDTFSHLFSELTTDHGVITLIFTYWINLLWTSLLNIFTSEGDILLALIWFVIAICVLLFAIYWAIKIIFVIMKNFAMLMLTIVTGPLEILVGAFTGKSTFGGWFKRLLSLVLVYPLLGLIFFFSFFFLWQGNSNGGTDNYAESMPFNVRQNMIVDNDWSPPFTTFMIFSDGGPSASDGIIWLAVSLMIFSQATKALEIVQSAMNGKAFGFGSAIGEAIGFAGSTTRFVSGLMPRDTPGKGAVDAVGTAIQTIGASIR